MRKNVFILLLLFVLAPKKGFPQYYQQLDSLCMVCERSVSDPQKVHSLGQLANFYYIFKLNGPADSVLHEQLSLAEISNDSSLILKTLFGDAILNIGEDANSESYDKATEFIEKGINYAKANGNDDYLVLGYVRMSEILRKKGDYEQAVSYSGMALSSSQNVSSDSIKAMAYLEFGNAYLATGNAVMACTNYNNAYDIAFNINSITLQSKIHHQFAEMYSQLGYDYRVKEELDESLNLNKKFGNQKGMILDYFDLARLTNGNEKYYIQLCIALADSLHDYKNLLAAKRVMLAYYYVNEKNLQKSLAYLANETDVKQSYLNEGLGSYLSVLGYIFYYTGNIDSALVYFKLAQPEFDQKFEHFSSRVNLQQIGRCYRLKDSIPQAISYFLKAIKISEEMKDLNSMTSSSEILSDLYERQNDYKNSLHYSKQFIALDDSLKKLSKENEIARLSVDRINRKHETELFRQMQQANITRNIQYMGITIAIIIVFFIMLFVGSYPVSQRTVKIMGYFFFISLFEFIILLLDNLVLARAVHNQPLKLWLIKIGVIALLVPFQHFLEHHLIGLLASKKLVEARTHFSIRKWWAGITKPAPPGEESLEEDTAVL